MDAYVERLVLQLMKLTAQPKKLFVSLATTTIQTILQNVSLQLRLIERFSESLLEKNAAVREKSVEFVREIVDICIKDPQGYRQQLNRSSSALDSIDKMLGRALSDASQPVRERARDLYFVYKEQWKERAEALLSRLEPAVKRSLERERSGNSAKPRNFTRTAISALREKAKTRQESGEEVEVVIFTPPSRSSQTSAASSSHNNDDKYDDHEKDDKGHEDIKEHEQELQGNEQSMMIAEAEGDVSFMNMSMPPYDHFNASFAIEGENCDKEEEEEEIDENLSFLLSNTLQTAAVKEQLTPQNKPHSSFTSSSAAVTARQSSVSPVDVVPSPNRGRGMVGCVAVNDEKCGAAVVSNFMPPMTPLIRRKRGNGDIFKTPLVMMTSPPDNHLSNVSNVAEEKLMSRLELIRQGQATEKLLRKLYKLSKQPDEIFHAYFPHIIDALLTFLVQPQSKPQFISLQNRVDKEQLLNVIYMKENCLILLKRFLSNSQLTELFVGLEGAVIKSLIELCVPYSSQSLNAPVNSQLSVLVQGVSICQIIIIIITYNLRFK